MASVTTTTVYQEVLPAGESPITLPGITTTLNGLDGSSTSVFEIVYVQIPTDYLGPTSQGATTTVAATPGRSLTTVSESYAGTQPIAGPFVYTSAGTVHVQTLATYDGLTGPTLPTTAPTTATATSSIAAAVPTTSSPETSTEPGFLPSGTASSSSTLSSGAVAGISVACTAIGIAALAALVWFLMKRYEVIRRKPQDEQEKQRVALALAAKDNKNEKKTKYEVEQTPISLHQKDERAELEVPYINQELETQHNRHELSSKSVRRM